MKYILIIIGVFLFLSSCTSHEDETTKVKDENTKVKDERIKEVSSSSIVSYS